VTEPESPPFARFGPFLGPAGFDKTKFSA